MNVQTSCQKKNKAESRIAFLAAFSILRARDPKSQWNQWLRQQLAQAFACVRILSLGRLFCRRENRIGPFATVRGRKCAIVRQRTAQFASKVFLAFGELLSQMEANA
jgi:hypothetical protein